VKYGLSNFAVRLPRPVLDLMNMYPPPKNTAKGKWQIIFTFKQAEMNMIRLQQALVDGQKMKPF